MDFTGVNKNYYQINPFVGLGFKGNPFEGSVNPSVTTASPKKVNAISSSVKSNPLFNNNHGKGLAPQNNISGMYAGVYNNKPNYLNQICIA